MRAVSVVIRHKNFDMNSYNHDVALLKLRKSVKFSTKIRPICLPQSGNIGIKLSIVLTLFFNTLNILVFIFNILSIIHRK